MCSVAGDAHLKAKAKQLRASVVREYCTSWSDQPPKKVKVKGTGTINETTITQTPTLQSNILKRHTVCEIESNV
jgi:hypothetical protein